MQRATIAVDAREVARKNLGSLGGCVLSTLKFFDDCKILLFSDVPVKREYIAQNMKNVYRGKECIGGLDLLRYQMWMKKEVEKTDAICFYQINHYMLTRMKIPSITVIHDMYQLENIEHFSWRNKLLYKFSIMSTLINSSEIIAITNFTKNRLEHFFWKSKKVTVIYQGVNDPPKWTIAGGHSIVDGKYVLMLGRVSFWKGTIYVAEFFDKYEKDSGYKLIIAGEAKDDNDVQKIKELQQKNPDIIWMNYVSDSVRENLLQNCECLLYASRYDGFGLPPLEAAIRRVPVIINNIPVLREATQNAGYYVDFYDINQLRTTFERLKHGMVDFNLEKMYLVAASYTWEAYAKKLRETMNKICGDIL